jgi:hypothetical protein
MVLRADDWELVERLGANGRRSSVGPVSLPRDCPALVPVDCTAPDEVDRSASLISAGRVLEGALESGTGATTAVFPGCAGESARLSPDRGRWTKPPAEGETIGAGGWLAGIAGEGIVAKGSAADGKSRGRVGGALTVALRAVAGGRLLRVLPTDGGGASCFAAGFTTAAVLLLFAVVEFAAGACEVVDLAAGGEASARGSKRGCSANSTVGPIGIRSAGFKRGAGRTFLSSVAVLLAIELLPDLGSGWFLLGTGAISSFAGRALSLATSSGAGVAFGFALLGNVLGESTSGEEFGGKPWRLLIPGRRKSVSNCPSLRALGAQGATLGRRSSPCKRLAGRHSATVIIAHQHRVIWVARNGVNRPSGNLIPDFQLLYIFRTPVLGIVLG